ncbi:DUF6701 domain-containing protein [Vibrio tapetis]|uniref:Putative MSHA biogenesis protein MshQ n=1 Tax=Vibrio tapetis subsp. tapetis TaxID=1671868 RepID=A0A2N8ZFI1_9VIBR|nr:DUF6701 domain-containing protein [Vibrio tapetis]SON50674.1 putative MSHA biogenesis protein MshQ [Vibrio tapetis subsp. tapetis]
MNVLIKWCFLSVALFSQFTFAQFPFPGGECRIKTGVQTWTSASSPKLEIKDKAQVLNLNNSKLVGFSAIEDNHSNSCGHRNRCEPSTHLRTDEPIFNPNKSYGDREKEFKKNGSLASGSFKKVEIKDSARVTFLGGTYWIKKLEIKEHAKLIVNNATVINVEELTVEGRITNSGVPGDLIIIAHDDDKIEIKSKNSAEIKAFFISQDEIEIKEKSRIRGALLSRKIKLDDDAKVTTDLRGCDAPPPPVDNAKLKFGVINCPDILTRGCEIDFGQTFTSVPILAVMPTIDKNFPDLDQPSTLVVESISSTKANVKQVFPPNLPWVFPPTEMTSVSFIAMEEGTATVNGHTILAGSFDTRSTLDSTSDWNWDTMSFVWNYGVWFNERPALITQVQSDNNSGSWMTAAISGLTDAGFWAALDLSRSWEVGRYNKEKVGFIATEPFDATIDGKKISFSNEVYTLATKGKNPTALADECDYVYDLPFDAQGVVGNKVTRNGPNGGWARRCVLENSQVSFVIDEDFYNRAHTWEEVGYVAFEAVTPFPDFDVCEAFPYPAGSWKSNSKLIMNNAPLLPKNQDPKYYIGGWAGKHCSPSEQNCTSVLTSFDRITDNTNSALTCQSGVCSTGGQKVDTSDLPTVVLPTLSGNATLNYSRPDEYHGTNNDICDVTVLGDSCHAAGHGDGVITLRNNVRKLQPNYTGLSNYPVTYLVPDNTTIYIDQLFFNATNSKLKIGNNATLIVRQLTMNHNTNSIEAGTKSRILMSQSITLQDSIPVNPNGKPDDLIIYALNDNSHATFNFKTDNVLVNAHLLFDKVTINSQGGDFGGSVISNNLIIHDPKTIIRGQNACYDTPQNYTLELSPLKQFFLLCENPLATFRVLTDSGVAESYPGEIEITLPAELSVKEVVVGHYVSGNKYRPSNGVLQLRLKASKIGEFSMQGQLSTDASQSQTGSYYIAPYKFDIPTVGAIAGKSTEFDINVLACKNDQETLVTDYSGERTLTYTASTLTKPAGGVNPNLEISAGENTPNLNKQVKLNFSSGKASAYMKFNEAGAIWSQISDLSFKCPTGFDCDIEGGESWSGLKGTLNVELRPWTFAICESDSHAMNGTAKSGNKYIAAGEEFDIQLKPVIWNKDLNEEQQKAKYSDFCSLAITQNFFDENAWSSKVGLEAELPTGFVGTFSGADTEKLNTEGKAKQHISFAEVSFSDVGHFTLKAKGTGYESVQGGIDTGKREIGRFYPKHIIVKSNSWEYVSKHDDFAYLDQPIAIAFIAEAQNSDNEATLNYSKLASEYKATLLPFAANGEGSSDWNSRMLAPWEVQSWINAELEVDEQSFTLLKLVEKASPKTTRIDGPFDGSNLMTGIKIKSGLPDPTVMKKQDSSVHKGDKFPTPLKARYGRVIIEDLGGSVGQTLTIPLRTEFWNGNEFVTNTDDSGTEFDGAGYCSLGIWPNTSSTARLSGGGDVVNGSSSKLVASQGTAGREQVRLWLRTASQTPSEVPGVNCKGFNKSQPWLNFNWRGKGDEIPSTVVTFGSFRGNDRVIFRGESRMTGQ